MMQAQGGGKGIYACNRKKEKTVKGTFGGVKESYFLDLASLGLDIEASGIRGRFDDYDS
jgi:hypothetical protein